MLQLVITVGLPALFIADVSRIPLQPELFALPLSGVLIILVTLGLSLLAGKALKLPRTDQGALTICGMSINNGFLFPFVIAVWGPAGFAHLALFDLGNALCAEQSRLCHARPGTAVMATGVVAVPAPGGELSALVGPGCRAAAEWQRCGPARTLVTVLGTIGRTILLLVIVALGVLFDVSLVRDRRVLTTLALRSLCGLALGFCCVWLFGLTGLTRSVVLLGSAAPIGFSAVVIANREHLNRELPRRAQRRCRCCWRSPMCRWRWLLAARIVRQRHGLP